MLKANDKKFDPDTGVEVTGFVVDVTPEERKKLATVPERIYRIFISMLFKDEATPKTSDGISSWR